MNKPREFWIDEFHCPDRGAIISDVGYNKPHRIGRGQDIIQLIEKSSADSLLNSFKDLISWAEKIHEKPKYCRIISKSNKAIKEYLGE